MSAYKLARGVRLRATDGETPLLLVPEGIVELNESAAATLALVDGTRECDAIAGELAARFDAEPGELERDVAELLADFAARGFLTT